MRKVLMLAAASLMGGVALAEDIPESVAPLMSTEWGQDAPYNNLCPEYADGRRCKTSCVATAMAQVMRYHSYPARGTGQKSIRWSYGGRSEILTADFGSTEYQWDLMLDRYRYGSYTDAQADAVATIMYQCGVAADAEYSPASGAYIDDAYRAAIDYFGYSDVSVLADREYFDDSVWNELVLGAIAAGYPVYYGGYTSSYAGHAFVIDGYDKRGYVHVNWGFGNGGGYYSLSNLTPYVYGQSAMIFYPSTPSGIDSWMVCSPGVSVAGEAVSRDDGELQVNVDVRNFTGTAPRVTFGLRLTDDAGRVSYVSGQSLRLPDNRYVSLADFRVDGFEFEFEGNFMATPVYRMSSSEEWRPVKMTRIDAISSFFITVTQNEIFPSMSKVADIIGESTDFLVDSGCIRLIDTSREANIYDVDGRLVEKLDSRRVQSRELSPGVYLIAVGSKVRKIKI
ncbi:MAG: C10 family peptidase [Pseudoflavonifractor sp.]|nr:C10 family peptidase [Pseudoflavonifractor sp.]